MSHRVQHLCLALLLCGSTSVAQTLAHPGWRGNGISSESWWKHTAFVMLGANTTFAQQAATMDAMSEAGTDSMILPDLQPSGSARSDADGVVHPFDRKFGTEEDLDALLSEASARRMHVLLRADLLRLAGSPGELRFWMSRGIAGFDLGEVTRAQMDTMSLLRGAIDRFPGRRILLAHVADEGSVRASRQDPVTLHLLLPQEALTRSGFAGDAVEVHTAGDLKTALPNTTLMVDAALLTAAEAREDLRRTLAARGTHARPYGAGRSTGRSGRRFIKRRSR